MKFVANPAIEPLEARIAPARVILVGSPDSQGDEVVKYTEASDPVQDALFVDTEDAFVIDPGISGKVGKGYEGVADTFYIRLAKGDRIEMFGDSNFEEYLTVKSGNIVVFFVDADGDNSVERGEITGISMGKGASFTLRDVVRGDVVANLNERGTSNLADDEIDMSGLVSSQQFIGGIEILNDGSIGGSIIAGGGINFANVEGSVYSILTGDAANGKSIDFFPEVRFGPLANQFLDAPGGTGVLNVSAEPGSAGGSIKNITIERLGVASNADPFNGLLKAGNGGAGAAGGSISLVQITDDSTGFIIQAGDGGAGTTAKGGAGGAVSRIYISGTADATIDAVLISSGTGGSSSAGAGGIGGSMSNVFVGYRLFGNQAFPTDDLLIDTVRIEAGDGGSGKTGGAGGSVTAADVRVKTAEGLGDEIVIQGGAGGNALLTGGKGGAGGNLVKVVARNQDLAGLNLHADTLLQAGAGGTGGAAGAGGKGGSVSGAVLLGWELQVNAGRGGDGKTGGAGGSLGSLLIEKGEGIVAFGARFDAGFGGTGFAGAGGAGGNINGLNVLESDLERFTINGGNAADGGDGIGGKGGNGGFVQGVSFIDNDVSNGATQSAVPFLFRSGTGGDGTKGGGTGGNFKLLTLEAKNANVELFTGSGGNVSLGGTGKGGNAGSFDNISVSALQVVGGVAAFARVEAGVGGAGLGKGGAGGAGGDIRSTTVTADGTAQIVAGKGGDGQNAGAVTGGAAGRGGSIVVSQVTAGGGNGSLIAGDAGDNGAKAGAGGSISGLNADVRSGVFAQNAIEIRAGDGSHGGAGGSIRFIGYGSSNITFSPAPFGNIDVLAGDGSADGKVAGAGGSIVDVSGSLASEDPSQPGVIFTTSFLGGQGGSSAFKSGAGGSVKDIAILSGGYEGAVLRVQAGDAGDAMSASSGAKGGDVQSIIVNDLEEGTIFRAVVAGDGGSSAGKGGVGGSIDSIYVDNMDIGSRTDVPFGVDQMGGLFAGAGGTGATPLKAGLNGKVSNVVAKGIGAIVAGKDLIPLAAESVTNITLSGTDTLLRESNVFVQPGPFRLSFTAEATATATTEGGEAVNEIQQILLSQLRDASVGLIFHFGDDQTLVLDGDSTDVEIRDALNALPSVVAAGGVTVSNVANGIAISFVTFGDKVGLFSVEATAETGLFPDDATAADVEGALNNLATIQYLGASQAVPTNGTVDVIGQNGSFKVTFQQNGNVLPLEGIEVFSSNLTEVTQGSVQEVDAGEVFPGAQNFLVEELQSGEELVLVTATRPGDAAISEQQAYDLEPYVGFAGGTMQFAFTSTGAFFEQTAGTAALKEVQTLDLTGIRADSRSTFTLTYNGVTSVPLAFNASLAQIQAAVAAMSSVSGTNAVTVGLTGNLLSINFTNNGARNEFTASVSSTTNLISVTATDAVQEAALNGMGSVKFTAANRTTGAVDVLPPDALTLNAYFVDFVEVGDQQPISLRVQTKEVQEIDHSILDADPTGQFTLSFTRLYTATEPIKGGAAIKERQDIAWGPIDGQANTSLVFSFNGKSTTTALFGNSPIATIESVVRTQLGLPGLVVGKSGTTLTFTFPTNGDNPNLFSLTATSKTAPLPGDSLNTVVQTALNGLPTIKGPGVVETVTVSTQPDGDFEVLFNVNGARNMIVAALSAQETQELDVRELLDDPTGSFRLLYGGDPTAELSPNASAADVKAALDALDSIQAASPGGVAVTEIEDGLFNVEFSLKGDQLPITVRLEVDEVQNVDYTPGKDLTLGVNLDFVASETLAGDAAIQEVQTIGFGTIIRSDTTATFSLSFFNAATNEVETTSVLPSNATEAQIQQAIDALNVFAPGDIDVDADATSVSFTFANPGDVGELFTARVTDTAVLEAGFDAATAQTALNALATVQASGFNGSGGTVTVTAGAGSNFDLRFNTGGDIPMVDATQEQALIVSTVNQGNEVQPEIQAFSSLPKGQPTDAAYAIANLIGFYADHSEVDANIFHYLRGGTLMTSLQDDFRPGDQPIDGLVFAKKMTGVNVTPEAYRVGDVFYDWKNII